MYILIITELIPYKSNKKVLSILGDSISTIYGKENYSFMLADSLDYELHNASVLSSTVSKISDVDNAIKRYKKDMMSFKSDMIIIFWVQMMRQEMCRLMILKRLF